MNDLQKRQFSALKKVSFGTGNPAKRFVRDVTEETELTERQDWYVRFLLWRFRKQVARIDAGLKIEKPENVLDRNSWQDAEKFRQWNETMSRLGKA